MSLRIYILLMILATIAATLAFLAVVYFFDPLSGSLLALILFYTSLFLSLLGGFSVLGLVVRMVVSKERLVFKKVVNSFRQGIWFSLLILIALFLKSENILIWQYLLFLIIAFALLELFFISYKSKASLKI